MNHYRMLTTVAIIACTLALTLPAFAQQKSPAPGVATTPTSLPSDYVIGPEDVLGVLLWREPDMSGDVTVRPDGIITLPLVGDLIAAGLTPDVLKSLIEKAASRLVSEPKATVMVRTVNSRKIFITGQVATPGAYPLLGPRTIMQLIALAGGLLEYADSDNITTLRTVNGKQVSHKFRYKDVARGKNLSQNIELQPGDTVVVP